jgi:uncharacterized protein YuzE
MVTLNLTLRYDPEADAAYIYLVPPGPERSVARSSVAGVRLDRAAITIDFTSEDLISGIEILGASRVLPPDVLRGASEAETG